MGKKTPIFSSLSRLSEDTKFITSANDGAGSSNKGRKLMSEKDGGGQRFPSL